MYSDKYGRLRGTRNPDRAHQTKNCLQNADAEAGDYIVILETTVGANWLHGPFEGDTNFQGFKRVIVLWLHESNEDNAVFQFFYADLCRTKRHLMTTDFGTQGHMRFVWLSLRKSRLLQGVGSMVKLRRWKS